MKRVIPADERSEESEQNERDGRSDAWALPGRAADGPDRVAGWGDDAPLT